MLKKYAKHSKMENLSDCFWNVIKLPITVSHMKNITLSLLSAAEWNFLLYFTMQKFSQGHKQHLSELPDFLFLFTLNESEFLSWTIVVTEAIAINYYFYLLISMQHIAVEMAVETIVSISSI